MITAAFNLDASLSVGVVCSLQPPVYCLSPLSHDLPVQISTCLRPVLATP